MSNRLKKSLPEKYQKRTETSLVTAVLSASLATLTCYPLDTVRRQMQLKGTPYKTVLDAISGLLKLLSFSFSIIVFCARIIVEKSQLVTNV
jgi:hypothetical protein